eukprot:749343-Hanusia_phi.AAC.3
MERSKSAHVESGSSPLDAKSGRAMINSEIAREIFMVAKTKIDAGSSWAPTSTSIQLGEKYGVTAKAIRDIWNKRTWAHATESMWSDEERASYKRMRTSKSAATREHTDSGSEQEASSVACEVRRTEHDQPETTGILATIHSSQSSNPFVIQNRGCTEAVYNCDMFSKDGWMMCPNRIAMFLQNIQEVRFEGEF